MAKTKADIIRELVRRFPDAPAKTLARKAMADHPGLWKDLEDCRQGVRRVLGNQGRMQRDRITDPGKRKFFREPRKAGWPDVIPEALTQLPDADARKFPGPLRVLILSDLHIPYHDAAAVQLALQYGLDHKATMVLLNGDIVDHFALSRWEKDPRQRDFPAEVRDTKKFLTGLRKLFPRAVIVYRWGNHEERWTSYLRLKAPELLGLPDFEWQNIFDLKKNRIEMVADKRLIQLGKLNTIHGHEYRFQISSPVNPARGLFLRAKDHALCGHFHQASFHPGKTIEGKVISCWSTGCLCNMRPEYAPYNEWHHGFAFVTVDKSGAFHVENPRIIDGRVW